MKRPRLRLRLRRLLPLLSAIAFAVALAFLATDEPWAFPMALALYLLVLTVALERTGL